MAVMVFPHPPFKFATKMVFIVFIHSLLPMHSLALFGDNMMTACVVAYSINWMGLEAVCNIISSLQAAYGH